MPSAQGPPEAAPEPQPALHRPALAQRVGVLAAGLVLLGTLAVGLAEVDDETTRGATRELARMHDVADIYAAAWTLPLESDADGEDARLSSLARRAHVDLLIVTGPNAEVIAWGGHRNARVAWSADDHGGLLAVAEPLPTGDLVVVASAARPGIEATAAAVRAMVMSVGFGLGAGIVLFVVVHRLLRPIDRMAQTALEATRLRRYGRWEEDGLPEFRFLAATLNRLGDAVRSREEELHARAAEEVRREHAWARSLIEGSPAGVVVLDPQDRVTDANRAAEWAVHDRALHSAIAVAVSTLPAGRPGRIDGPGERRTRMLKVPSAGGATVLFMEDITREELLQGELSHAREGALTGGLAAQLAHEVRNPVHAADLHFRLLMRATSDGDRDRAIDLLRGELAALRRVVDAFLDLTRLETAKLGAHVPATLTRMAMARVQPLHPGNRFSLEDTTDGFPRLLDARLMELALVNLLRNAAQALTSAGRDGHIETHLSIEQDDLCFVISDDGPGVNPALTPKLFDPFVTGRPSGTGLGLAVVRRAAEAHGGTARLLLDRTVGAHFEIRLPDRSPEQDAPR